MTVSETLRTLIDEFDIDYIYLLLDEWSETPIKCQPILAELLKRAFITQKLSLKIAAIPNRTQLSGNNFTGLEDGGDIFGYSLDNRYIYELSQDLTKSFFNELLYNHLVLIDNETYKGFYDKQNNRVQNRFINSFLANQSLREILIGSAGIPRDFLHIFINSYRNFIARKTSQKHLALADVRNGTIEWYGVDKLKAVEANHDAKILLNNIINEIIINKKRCHFLIPEKHESNKVLNDLIDLRVIHLRKKGISHKGNKGVIYNVYYIDYACYTSSNIYHNRLNSNLLNEIETIEDLRDIRRISLDDKFFSDFNLEIGNSIKCTHCNKNIDLSHAAYIKQHVCNHCFEKVD